MTAVVIGVDPHKRSNTALVLDPQENGLIADEGVVLSGTSEAV